MKCGHEYGLGSTGENMGTQDNGSVGYCEMKQHKPWFDRCSELLDKNHQAKLQQLHNLNQITRDNLNNEDVILVELLGTKKDYLKVKNNELVTNI